MLHKLACEAALPVNEALVQFANRQKLILAAPFAVSVCESPPTVFVSTASVDSCYNLWLSLPIPDYPQLAVLSRQLKDRCPEVQKDAPVSIKLATGPKSFYLPTWILNLWPRLRSITAYTRAWATAKAQLQQLSLSLGNTKDLSLELLSRLSTISLDSFVSNLTPFRTSFIPDLICDAWL